MGCVPLVLRVVVVGPVPSVGSVRCVAGCVVGDSGDAVVAGLVGAVPVPEV